MGLTLSAVYPDYFGSVPRSLYKGSSKIKGVFKGQYQVYPPIRTITLSNANFEPVDINKYVIVQVFKEENNWYYVITNTTYVPSFRIWLHRSYTVTSSYGSYTDIAEGYVDISGGTKTLGNKYSFTLTMTTGSAYYLSGSGFTYGIGTTSGGGSYNSTYQDISGYRVCAHCSSPGSHLRGGTIYKWYHGNGTYFPNKVYCAANAFSITYQTGNSTYNTITVPSTNSGTSSFGYLYGDYFWLYDSRMPRIPYMTKSSNDLKLKIYNISSTPSTSNAWHYLSAYFNNKTFGTLTNYYKNLTGDTSNINLFDYGVQSSQLTTYRYDIPNTSSNTLWQIKKGSQYEWDFAGATATFYINPSFSANYTNGFYILGFYLTEPGASFYFNAWQQQGANHNGEINYNCNNLSVGSYKGIAGTTTWGLNQADKFDIRAYGFNFNSYGSGIYETYGRPNESSTHNLGSSQLTIKLTGLKSTGTIYKSGTTFCAGWGIDWFDTWAWAYRDVINSTSVDNYFNTAPTGTGQSKSFTVYCLCWSGYYQTAHNQVSMMKLGTFTVYSKTSTGVGTIEMH